MEKKLEAFGYYCLLAYIGFLPFGYGLVGVWECVEQLPKYWTADYIDSFKWCANVIGCIVGLIGYTCMLLIGLGWWLAWIVAFIATREKNLH